MSYQKHHAPSQQVINENEEYEDDLKVIRPLLGIESNKHQPIVRANRNVAFNVTPHEATPIDYDSHLKSVMSSLLPKQEEPEQKAAVKQSSKKTQTTFSQTTTQYPSTSSGNSTKYFSLK